MLNVTTSPELPKNNQAPNETAKSQQPKKTWVEPELAILGVEGGNDPKFRETSINSAYGTNS